MKNSIRYQNENSTEHKNWHTTLNLVPDTKCNIGIWKSKKRYHHPARGRYPTRWPPPLINRLDKNI